MIEEVNMADTVHTFKPLIKSYNPLNKTKVKSLITIKLNGITYKSQSKTF